MAEPILFDLSDLWTFYFTQFAPISLNECAHVIAHRIERLTPTMPVDCHNVLESYTAAFYEIAGRSDCDQHFQMLFSSFCLWGHNSGELHVVTNWFAEEQQ